MNATQQNVFVILAALAVAGVLAVLVGALSSRRLREEGVRRLVKRWLGR